MNVHADYPSQKAHKYLTDNRDRYILQSALTQNGIVAPLPAPPCTQSDPPLSAGLGVARDSFIVRTIKTVGAWVLLCLPWALLAIALAPGFFV